MSNVEVTNSMIFFRPEEVAAVDDASGIGCPQYLLRRERAERAAAKRSTTVAARRVHQELAQMLYAARKQLEHQK